MSKTPYTVEAVIKDGQGNVATVTSMKRDGQMSYSFSLEREFDRDDQTFHTHWFQLRHIPEVRVLLDRVTMTIDQLRDRDRASARSAREPKL